MRRLQRLRMQLLSSCQLASDFLRQPAQLTRAPTDILSKAAQSGCLRAARAAASAASAARFQPALALTAGSRETRSLPSAGSAAADRPASTAAGTQSAGRSSQAAAAPHISAERAQPGACAAAQAAPRAHAGRPAAEAEKAAAGRPAAEAEEAVAGAPAAEAEKAVRASREALLRRLGVQAGALGTRVQRDCLLHARTDAGLEALVKVLPSCTFLACAMHMVRFTTPGNALTCN